MIAYADAVAADGPELDAMARTSWVETFAHSCSPEDLALYLAGAYGPDGQLLRDLADPAVRFRLARADGQVAGYAKLIAPYLAPELTGPDARQLAQLYVASPWHGRGVAAALMDWTITAARTDAARALVLTVWEENARALAFYRRRGFVAVGDYAFQTGTQVDRDIVMRLDL